MTLPRPKERARREQETEDLENGKVPTTEKEVQVISNEQLIHLKLDKMQVGIDTILKLCQEPVE